ncbi:MAG: hypothetical protein K9N10_09905 [Deltaproteobacteria bacterium]|nr:hypothetical protein [Deltaproteobacteria bacterium]
MKKQTIMRSPVGPLAWEYQLVMSEAQYPDFRSFSIPSPSLPELRPKPSLPVLRDSEACRLARIFPRISGPQIEPWKNRL